MRVPHLDGQAVRQGATPTPYFEPGDVEGALGAGLGGAVQRAASQAAQVYEHEHERQLSVAVQSTLNQATTWENETMRSALELKGRDAFGIAQKHLSEFDKLASANEVNLRDERAKLAYRAGVERIRGRLHSTLRAHEMGQVEAVEKAETVSAMDRAVSNAALLHNNPEAIASNLDDGERAVRASAARNGLTPEILEGELRDFRTRLHSSVVAARLAAGQGVAAREYLAANRDEMDGTVAAALQEKVQSMADDQQVNLDVDALLVQSKGEYGPALAAIKPDDPLRDRKEAELQQRRDQATRIREDEERKVWDLFYPAWTAAGRSWSTLAAAQPELWAALSSKQQEAVRNEEMADFRDRRALASMSRQERDAAKAQQRLDSADKYGQYLLLAENDPGAFLSAMADPTSKSGLIEKDARALDALKVGVIRGARQAGAKGITSLEDKVLLERALAAKLISDSEVGGGADAQAKRIKNARLASLLDSYGDWRASYIEAHQRVPDREATEKAVDSMLIKSIHDPWGPFGDYEAFRFEEKFNPKEVEIPDDFRDRAVKRLQAKGKKADDAAVRDLYLRSKAAPR
jgi:hypothetical protein